jgi:tetratricopeptide repeat protein/FG-GAP repeat protein/VCBS repeat protein
MTWPTLRWLSCAIVLTIAGFSGSGAKPSKAGLSEAVKRLQGGDPAAAAAILSSLTEREPGNAEAWRMLGVVRLKTPDPESAAAAFRKSLAISPNSPKAMYGLAQALARTHHEEEAFGWLEKAKARKMDMTGLEADANLAALKKDPRLAKLLPEPRDFENPFVEDVKLIREWDGEAAEDQFGWIARNIGDVDGDGVNDFVTSAPTNAAGGEKAGRIYVYSTRTGKLLWKADGKAGEELGTGVESAGDVDGDGVGDVVAGAPGGGKVYVYSGKDGRIVRTFTAEKASDDFGRHASGAGDVDRDGFTDVIVGAPSNDAGGKGAGRAYVFSGKDGHALLTLTGERAGDAFGSTVAGYADKAHVFLIVGAPGAGPGAAGRTYVYGDLSGKPRFVIESDATGSALGAMFVSVLGDVDGDGTPDIYASDWSNDAKGVSTGRVYVHSGKDGHRLLTLTGETAGEGFGIGPATAGDVDGDGRADLVVGSWQYAGAAVSAGRVCLYSGKTGQRLKTFTCRVAGDTFGFDAVGMGDVDGDGTLDLLVTSAWSGVHGHRSGRVFIVSSGIRRLLGPAAPSTKPRATGPAGKPTASSQTRGGTKP